MKLILFATAFVTASAGIAQEKMMPSNAAPEHDARGIPVVSDPAVTPTGANEVLQPMPGAIIVVAPNQSAVFSAQASDKTYVACTKTITDGCVQTYERSSHMPR